MNKGKEIVQIAHSFCDIVEYPGNTGWNNQEFQHLMIQMGWKRGQPWCMYFTKLCWTLAYKDTKWEDEIRAAYNGSVKASFFKAKSYFRISKVPVIGSIACFSTGDITGHSAICLSDGAVNPVRKKRKVPGHKGTFETIEGNTNMKGSREGDSVMQRERNMLSSSNFQLMGFIVPPEL